VALLVAITAVLGVLTVNHIGKTHFVRSVQGSLDENLAQVVPGARLSGWEVIHDDHQNLTLSATVYSTEEIDEDQIATLQTALSDVLGRPVSLWLNVIRTLWVTDGQP